MGEFSTRADLETRLRSVARRLIVRQLVRSAFTGVAVAAGVLGLAVVFLDVLPRILFATTGGVFAMLIAAGGGLVAGMAWELRRYRAPSLQEAALALEARLPHDTGALAASLRIVEASAFYRPLLARAAEELKQAEQQPAPLLISTKRLVLIPLMVLAAGVAFAAAASAAPPVDDPELVGADDVAARDTWASVDVGGTRSETDRDAYRKALGMRETAAKLNRAAAVLRNTESTPQQRQDALTTAKKAVEEGGEGTATLTSKDMPDAVPADTPEREALASKLEGAASVMAGSAAKLEPGKPAGTEDSGASGTYDVNRKREDLVRFPVVWQNSSSAEAIAVQTPGRRAMAERAIKALDKRQER